MSYPIPDYLTVFPSADNNLHQHDGVSVFNVPASTYMSNAKGQYCLVSLVDGSAPETTTPAEAQPRLIVLRDVLNNGGNDAVIGTFNITAMHSSDMFKYSYLANNIKYLMPSRPSQLRIKVLQEDGTAFDLQSGHLTFRFDYLSKKEVEEMNNESETTTF